VTFKFMCSRNVNKSCDYMLKMIGCKYVYFQILYFDNYFTVSHRGEASCLIGLWSSGLLGFNCASSGFIYLSKIVRITCSLF
jgi:hypothetical protein